MSTTAGAGTTLTVAAVTAILKDVLINHLVRHNAAALIGDVSVSSLPPDRSQNDANNRSQIHLFLYRLTPDTRWRRQSPPDNGSARSQPAIALDLHYLLTARSDQDLHVEILLGHAVQAFHDAAILTPEIVRAALGASGSGSGIEGQIQGALRSDRVIDGLTANPPQVVPEFMSTEELSRLWSSLQSRYHPSLAYTVRSVLIGDSGGM